MKKIDELIQKVKDGKVAILNDGTVEQLKEVLLACFPLETCIVNPIFKYFYAGLEKKGNWYCHIQTNLPTVSVKEFYEDEFVWGEQVRINYNNAYWVKCFYVGKNPLKENEHIVLSDSNNLHFSNLLYKLPLKTKLTHQMIADKFDIDVNTLEII